MSLLFHSFLDKETKLLFLGLLLLSFNILSFANTPVFTLVVNCNQIQAATNESSTNGIGAFTINGGVPPFSYQLLDAMNQVVLNGTVPTTNTTIQLNDLAGGTYRVEIMGQNEMQSCMLTIGLTNCSLGVSVANTTVDCASDLGNLMAIPTNGVDPLTYLWDNGVRTPNLTNVASGTYTVTVTDNAGCMATDMGTITALSPTTVALAIISTTPSADFQTTDGTITFSTSGGANPYDVVITNTLTNTQIPLNGLGTSNVTINNLSAGNYSIKATDANGCTGTNTFQLGVNTCLFAVTVADINTDCDITNNTLTAVPNNMGIAPFTYAWSNMATTASISNLILGTYTLTATDAIGCQSIVSGAVLGNSPPTLNCNTTQNNTLIGGMAGAATIEVRNGNPPYNTTLYLDNQVTSTFSIPNAGFTNLNNLATGQYRLNIVDQDNCPIVCTFEITEPACDIMIQLADLILPCVDERGDLQATIAGGVAPLTISWDNGPNTPLNANLLPGTYTITVRDAVNCVKTATATITTRDGDGDGYFTGCVTFPAGALQPDCDDNDNTVFPGAPEICDNKDNDCNGEIDEQLVDGQICPSRVIIPTMSDWGLLVFSLLVLNLSIFLIREHKKTVGHY